MCKKTIKIQAYQTPDGKPTCSVDFLGGQFCQFIMKRRFGTEYVCGALSENLDSYFDPSLGDYTYLKPGKACPVWKDGK